MATGSKYLTARVSRRTLFKGAGALGLGLALGQGLSFSNGPSLLKQAGLIRSAAAQDNTVQEIINIAATAEALAVTLLGGALASAEAGDYSPEIPDVVISVLQAARATEEYHYQYLLEAGAEPLTTTFTVPDPALLTDSELFFTTLVSLEEAFIAAYIAAAHRFAELNQTELVKVAYQVAGVESEHRVLANYVSGVRPANNLAYEQKIFTSVDEAAQLLQDLGFIGGDGQEVSYPGPGEIMLDLVTNTSPGGPSVICTVPGPGPSPMPPPAASDDRRAPVAEKPGALYFSITGHNVFGGFRRYWETYGGLPLFGYPLTEEFVENGMTVQYFERVRMEWHPGVWPSRWDVLLARFGVDVAEMRGLMGTHPFQRVEPLGSHDSVYFEQTGHNVQGGFLEYWKAFGDLEVYGFPISEAFIEDGMTVQYFERQRFEWHPGVWPERYDVLLGRLGDIVLSHHGM